MVESAVLAAEAPVKIKILPATAVNSLSADYHNIFPDLIR